VLPFPYFAWLLLQKGWTPAEKKRLMTIPAFFLFAALFWSVFEQAGSTLTLFADRFTRNEVFGAAFPSSWWQSVNSAFLIMLAPVFAILWLRLGRREPSSPGKFAFGLFFAGFGFLLMVFASLLSGPQGKLVSPMWLLMVYLAHTIGELCLSPVGLSTMTKLAPQRIAGQMLGVWFLASSVGNFIGGSVSGQFEKLPLPQLFGAVVAVTMVFTLVAVALLALTLRRGARDPVCGMTVDRGTALSAEHAGRRYFFCGPGCRAKFEADPERYAPTAASADPEAAR